MSRVIKKIKRRDASLLFITLNMQMSDPYVHAPQDQPCLSECSQCLCLTRSQCLTRSCTALGTLAPGMLALPHAFLLSDCSLLDTPGQRYNSVNSGAGKSQGSPRSASPAAAHPAVGSHQPRAWESLPGSGKLWNPEQVILLTVQICTSNNIFRSLEILEIMGW